ncbi:hypothetical protein MPTK1_8g18420 [Marchantia polymorpha subsp. ruderalis]|uniref:Uncharacterized protein n=1 Tax=Marchantia polymorpha TaxID=3197 RepID=A0A2R6W009_MARPO|nr:hypothetical protein MARPO_0213s0003 [Marchantia polymorpha]BBN20356.1 hypothetical protein Mp_8g18420 [Marchantia polymorpha subsp. ruderalis]|eukprot:PTQ27197.1 hypothetical protein MARPO_0213s0003 [Marchantia polymorpha]
MLLCDSTGVKTCHYKATKKHAHFDRNLKIITLERARGVINRCLIVYNTQSRGCADHVHERAFRSDCGKLG